MKKKGFIIFGIIFLISILMIVIVGYLLRERKGIEIMENVELKSYKNKDYYIITGNYKGEYDYQTIDFNEHFENENAKTIIEDYNTTKILNYEEYYKYCKKWGLTEKYNDSEKQYMVISYAAYGRSTVEARLANIATKDNKIKVYLWESVSGVIPDISAYFLVIPVDKSIKESEIIMTHTEEEYKNIKKYGTTYDPTDISEDKPILYIYPEKEIEVTIKLGHPELLTVSYPKYEKEWKVTAAPDGTLKDSKTNREYYGLYYESSNHMISIQKDGFVVKKEEIIPFLEEKLQLLGLNERESNEFIIYWLPILEKSSYNYIRFETKEEINQYMPLEINPKPDTIIRVVMDYKPLEKEIKVKEQELTKVERKGYTVVEWGGSEIKR